jgi:positive regulator of sigma E activity
MNEQTVMIIGKKKSVILSFLLTLFFGPIGLIYTSVKVAIITVIVSILVLFLGFIISGMLGNFFTLGPIIWIGTLVVSVMAVTSHNKKITDAINKNIGA